MLAEGVKRGWKTAGQANMAAEAPGPGLPMPCSSPLTSVGWGGSCPGWVDESTGVLAVDQTLRRQIIKDSRGSPNLRAAPPSPRQGGQCPLWVGPAHGRAGALWKGTAR